MQKRYSLKLTRTFTFTLALLSYPGEAITFSKDFQFGIANAPSQSEDQLDDTWSKVTSSPKIRAVEASLDPWKRLEFWTHPEKELALAEELGVQIFRMGIDWGRVMPGPNQIDSRALSHYRKTLTQIKNRKMKTMLTLFHFSLPNWLESEGGWTNPQSVLAFKNFARIAAAEFAPLVDSWITLNEPHIFAMLTYYVGVFPGGTPSDPFQILDTFFYTGRAARSINHLAQAHREAYAAIKSMSSNARIGIAQHMGRHQGLNFLGQLFSQFSSHYMNWSFIEKIQGSIDFVGINYYGAEWIQNFSFIERPDREYSESGRAIDPNGLYDILQESHNRYPALPIYITENGISDATDVLRIPYLLEHLAAIHKAIESGIPVKGYLHWTLSDNFEWTDGYCPKFGLVEVHRPSLKRTKRESFQVYRELIKSRNISVDLREKYWKKLQTNARKSRPYCRASDGISGLDQPIQRAFVSHDWRFRSR